MFIEMQQTDKRTPTTQIIVATKTDDDEQIPSIGVGFKIVDGFIFQEFPRALQCSFRANGTFYSKLDKIATTMTQMDM